MAGGRPCSAGFFRRRSLSSFFPLGFQCALSAHVDSANKLLRPADTLPSRASRASHLLRVDLLRVLLPSLTQRRSWSTQTTEDDRPLCVFLCSRVDSVRLVRARLRLLLCARPSGDLRVFVGVFRPFKCHSRLRHLRTTPACSPRARGLPTARWSRFCRPCLSEVALSDPSKPSAFCFAVLLLWSLIVRGEKSKPSLAEVSSTTQLHPVFFSSVCIFPPQPLRSSYAPPVYILLCEKEITVR